MINLKFKINALMVLVNTIIEQYLYSFLSRTQQWLKKYYIIGLKHIAVLKEISDSRSNKTNNRKPAKSELLVQDPRSNLHLNIIVSRRRRR